VRLPGHRAPHRAAGRGVRRRARAGRPGRRAHRALRHAHLVPSDVLAARALHRARCDGVLGVDRGRGPGRARRRRMMYGWIWRHLPGPTWVRVVTTVALAAAVVAVLFSWVFPALAPLMPFNQLTVGE